MIPPRSHAVVVLLNESGDLLAWDDGTGIQLPGRVIEPNESPVAAAFHALGRIVDLDKVRVLDQLNTASDNLYHLLMIAEGNDPGDSGSAPDRRWRWITRRQAIMHASDRDRRILLMAYQVFGGVKHTLSEALMPAT
jgi:hypothetical protein